MSSARHFGNAEHHSHELGDRDVIKVFQRILLQDEGNFRASSESVAPRILIELEGAVFRRRAKHVLGI